MTASRQLVVLVGGQGTRLGAATRSTPKPLMPIDDNRVFLDYFLESVARQGFEDILFLAGYLGEQVHERYDGKSIGSARLSVLIEPSPLGTGGAFRFARDRLDPTFIAANGDTLFDINIRALDHALHSHPDWLGALALRAVDDAGRYGAVTYSDDRRISAFQEKQPQSAGMAGLINGGIYALRREAIDLLPAGASSVEANLFPSLAADDRLGGIVASGYFLDIGLPETLAIARAELPQRKAPALFLDRDGVINVEKNYLFRIADFEWVDGIIDLIRSANDDNVSVVVVTNQAGVARGYYTEDDVHTLHRFIQAELLARGAFIDAFYHCPFHEDAQVETYRVTDHPDRKPNPGMILRAIKDLNLDPARSVLIGDQATDMQAATAAGVAGILYSGGRLPEYASLDRLHKA